MLCWLDGLHPCTRCACTFSHTIGCALLAGWVSSLHYRALSLASLCSSWLRNLGLAGSHVCQPVQGHVVTYHQDSSHPPSSLCHHGVRPTCVTQAGQSAPHPEVAGVPDTSLTWARHCCASTHVFTAVHPHICSQLCVHTSVHKKTKHQPARAMMKM